MNKSTEDVSEMRSSHEGNELLSVIQSERFVSIRPRIENLNKLKKISCIVFVGSSFTGKSTMVDALRSDVASEGILSNTFSIPKRIITRPQRLNDNLEENDFVKPEQFDQMIADGVIEVWWERQMEEGRKERYGFYTSEDDSIPVFSANNAIINNETITSSYPEDETLIIAVYAPEQLRVERQLQRSPDLKVKEKDYRLDDSAINMFPSAHVVIKNFGKSQEASQEEIVQLLITIKQLQN